jgi:transcriptional regulator with XRE-family HTH domain
VKPLSSKLSPKAVRLALGETIRKYRTATGESQMKLAMRAGVHFTYLSDAERGQRNVAIVNIVRIVRALGVPLAEFFGEVELQLRSR